LLAEVEVDLHQVAEVALVVIGQLRELLVVVHRQKLLYL
jgi:hypothetical protein